jgi:hypothetical protein
MDLADEVHQGLVLGHPAEGYPHPRGVGGEGKDLLELGGAEGAVGEDGDGDVLRVKRRRCRALVGMLLGSTIGPSLPQRIGPPDDLALGEESPVTRVEAVGGGAHQPEVPRRDHVVAQEDIGWAVQRNGKRESVTDPGPVDPDGLRGHRRHA